ncbi:type 2 isopentenyl-diphosphate Delta-isomerase [Pseudomonas typographi]|uniref:type 2 isopentenyl-diphosphate Delta-isomerase n=1 Tax=Pseudomonas typographi TaxID=2715964 RepID=UPI0016836E7F|nr:type 2 isopentenyl-diphosphate Delta-isomerase [Pseudomonas typographi]MBD1587072.1 type 2 isopentenyl-diphosphate Delta-isomerase [Pseudomonas typographi]
METDLVHRKNDHLDIILNAQRDPVTQANGFDRFRFEHCALPELDLDAIDVSTRVLGRTLHAPWLISSMTGGASRARTINLHLAEAAQALGIAMAVGSQRVALEGATDWGLTRQLRHVAPDILLMANLGAAQLRGAQGIDYARRAVDMIGADALVVHLNPLQEALQPEGDRDWRGVLAAIEQVARTCEVPLVVKEVGAGLSARVARQLADVGVSMLDVAGTGGTSWAAVEGERARRKAQREVAMAFAAWGIPTAQALHAVHRALPQMPLIASGGIRHGIDAAMALRLGASLVGQAAAVLAAACDSSDAVIEHFQSHIQQLRVVCFCTGSANLAALKQAPLMLTEARP